MKTSTFIGVVLIAVAVTLAVIGVGGMSGHQCSGTYQFVKQNCGDLMRGYALLFAGFGLGALGGFVLYRRPTKR